MTGARLLLALAPLAAGCGACEPNRPAPADASPSASATVSASGATSGAVHHSQNRLPCRAITVEGDAHFAGPGGADAGTTPLMQQGLFPVDPWVDLGPGARVVTKDPRTTRETSFRGPARVRACVDATEESWVASGVFESTVGAGETPGAEEWVATPLALFRYAAAKLAVTVQATPATTKEDAKVAAGIVYVWVAEDAHVLASGDGGALSLRAADDGWARIAEGQSIDAVSGAAPGVGHHPSTQEAAAEAALTRCRSLAHDAEDLATLVLRAEAGASQVRSQVSTRRLAHAACAVASVRVGALPDTDAKAALLSSLREGRAEYESLPLDGAAKSGAKN